MNYTYLNSLFYIAVIVAASLFIAGCESGDTSGLSRDIMYERQAKLIEQYQLDDISIEPAALDSEVSLIITTTHEQQFTAHGLKDEQKVVDLTNDVIWVSSDSSKVSINNQGLLVSLEDGDAKITASLASLTAGVNLRMSSAPLTKIEIEPKNAGDDFNVEVCSGLSLKASGIFGDETVPRAITSPVNWKLSIPDNDIAVFDADTGLLKVSATPTDSLTVTAESVEITSDPKDITVEPYPGGDIIVSPSGTTKISKGQTLAYTAVIDGVGTDISQYVVWKSSDTTVADFVSADDNERNIVTGKKSGSLGITANCDGNKNSASVPLEVIDRIIESGFLRDFDNSRKVNIDTDKAEILGLTESIKLTFGVKFTDGTEEDRTKNAKWDLTGWVDDTGSTVSLDESNDDYVLIQAKGEKDSGSIKVKYENIVESLEIRIQ